MGSAASTTGPTGDEEVKKKIAAAHSVGSTSSKRSGKSLHQQELGSSSRYGASQMVIEEPPTEQVPLFNAQDSAPEEKPAMSNGKLKKLALGIQGYKDQQRDYDSTLGTLDVNKTNQVQWSEPKVDEFATPKSKTHPSSPNRFKDTSDTSFSSPQLPIRALNHTPNQQSYSHGRSTEKMQNPNSSFNSGSSHDLTMSASFTRGPPIAMTPNHGPLTPGPPPGVPARPFPRNQDIDDTMSADFSSEHILQKHPSKPQNIPALNIPNSTPTSNKFPQSMGTPGGIPPGGIQPYQQGPPPGSAGGPRPFMSPGQPAKNAAPYPMGSPPPRALGPRGPFPIPNGSPSPVTLAAGITVQGPGAGGSGIMPSNIGPRPTAPMPVVKETTVVKRNKVDLPTNFNHAKPTAGDWLNKRYFVNNYILLDTLGVGSYGEVRLCKDRNTEKLYAIKIISKDFLKKKKQGKSDETYFEDIKREIAIMKKLLHPNILRLFEVLDDPKVNKMYLLLEYMKRGDLVNVLKKRGGVDPNAAVTAETQFTPLSDFEVWNITRQLVAGIRYLHFQNVIHGDIKPQNLLLGEDGIVKIADFGISKMLSASSQQLADAGGTPAFMSPELIEHKTSFSGQLADVWAMGATIFMLRFGRPPWVAKSIINLYNKICNEPLVFPGQLDPGLQNLLEGMLEKDPVKRFTIPQITAHPWYRYPPANTILPSIGKPSTAAAGGTRGVDVVTSGKDSQGSTKPNTLSFQPPASYESEEAEAMNKPMHVVDQKDVYMSILGGATRVRADADEEADPFASTVEDIDIDDDDEEEEGSMSSTKKDNKDKSKLGLKSASVKKVEPPKASTASNGVMTTDVMNTQWGNDVFQIVEDDDDIDDDDEVDDDCDEDGFDQNTDLSAGAGKSKKSKSSKLSSKSNATDGSDESGGRDSKTLNKRAESHSEMSVEEEARRSKQFIRKITRKSTHNIEKSEASSNNSSVNSSPVKGSKGSGNSSSINGFPTSFHAQSSTNSLFDESEKIVSVQLNMPSSPSKTGKPRKQFSGTYDEEETEELSTEDFHKMMDTLSQQNTQNNASKEPSIPEDGANPNAVIDELIVTQRNDKTAVGCAVYSDIGVRSSQEDRFVVLPSIAKLKALDAFDLHTTTKEQLALFSMVCIFDGHNGNRTSHHLSQFLPQMLATHEKFLDHRHLETAMMDTFSMIDFQVCQILSEEDDASGSTGVVAVYDGKRHVITVAGLGDSLCVLSRSGKAVEMNKMHRLDNGSEKDRVIKSGGKVISNRVNGVLAVTRAFGDTQFKSPTHSTMATGSSIFDSHPPLVIAEPEVRTELVTPKTEFAILATDGLWDVMNPQLAVTFVRGKLLLHRDLQRATKELVKEAINRGSIDNVTAIVVTFNIGFAENGN